MSELPVTICPLKLKTLKDLEILESDEDNPTQNVEWFIQELKTEAGKWVKNKKEKKKVIETHGAIMYAQGYIDCLIDFFNLTEKELKDDA